MGIFTSYERIRIFGTFPERALIRLQKSGISVYKAKKMQKNRLEMLVKRKDVEKVFAIFPNVCYNREANTMYSAEKCGATGFGKIWDFAKNRWGFLIGAVLFAGVSLYTDALVFGIDFSASGAYAREARAVLAEYGVKPFARYRAGNEDVISAKLLKLGDMEFCSIKRVGHRVVVEMRLGQERTRTYTQGDMLAERSGTVVAITALKGTLLKKTGDSVTVGEPLVGAYFETETERVHTLCVARVTLSCIYEAVVTAEDSESAFAKAYLETAGELTSREVAPCAGGYLVTLAYTYTQTMNF